MASSEGFVKATSNNLPSTDIPRNANKSFVGVLTDVRVQSETKHHLVCYPYILKLKL